MNQQPPVIHARGLRKQFADVTALDSLDLSVERGEVFGLVGPDGAGKTTLIRILCGLMAADAGEVSVAGVDVLAHPEEAKPHLGYLAQRFGLWGDMSIDENLRFCADLFGVPMADFAERREHLLAITRLAPFTDRLAQFLSGGMKQKLGLICTLIHRPTVLLLDEPTTGVDPASRRDFWRLLYDLPNQGVTTLVSTPYMDEAERCDRVALLHDGNMLACATPAELKAGVPGEMFSVAATPQEDARRALTGVAGVLSVAVFGDRLHVAVGEDHGETLIGDALKGVSVEFAERIEPTLEDVFTTAVREAAAHA